MATKKPKSSEATPAMMVKRLMQSEPLGIGEEWPETFRDADRVAQIHAEIDIHIGSWMERFKSSVKPGASPYAASFAEYEKEKPAYRRVLDRELLEEYADNPGGFKDFLKNECLVIRSTLNAQGDEFERYRAAFKRTSGDKLLTSIESIVDFVHEETESYDDDFHDSCADVDDLGWDTVESLGVEGVIGTGISSLFMHMLDPSMFPVRNKNSLIGLYFLTDKRNGLFLISHPERMGEDVNLPIVEPNFRYPYDLFVLHAAHVYRHLREDAKKSMKQLESKWRYRHVEAFLSFIAEQTKDYRKECWREKKFSPWSAR